MVGFTTHHTDEFTTRATRPRATPSGCYCDGFTFPSPPQLKPRLKLDLLVFVKLSLMLGISFLPLNDLRHRAVRNSVVD